MSGLDNQQQAKCVTEHYSSISNQYQQVQASDFQEYLSSSLDGSNPAPNIEPLKVYNIIQKMNKKTATVPNDIPMKLIDEFSVELAYPLSHIITFCLKNGVYPNIWKIESVTPVPKTFPPEKLKDLRKISGLLNCSKIADKIIGEFLIEDMEHTRAQYGNEKNVASYLHCSRQE